MMLIDIRKQPFHALQELEYYQKSLGISGKYGANAIFIGSMRDYNEDAAVTSMLLEHYPGMTEKYLKDIACHAVKQWDLLDVCILHRVGRVKAGEDIVLVASWSAHRKAAFESCRMVMEQLKSTAPFWKKENIDAGSRWVEKNTAGF